MLKVAHHNNEGLTPGERMALAKQYEDDGDLGKAVLVYQKVIAESKLNEAAYDRLMIIYRKQKEYEKEGKVIDKAVKEFEALYDHDARKNAGKKVTALSKALNKLTGLSDKKGNAIYEPEPLGRWKRRKQVVEKRLKAKK